MDVEGSPDAVRLIPCEVCSGSGRYRRNRISRVDWTSEEFRVADGPLRRTGTETSTPGQSSEDGLARSLERNRS